MKVKSPKSLCTECIYSDWKCEEHKWLVLEGCKWDKCPIEQGGQPTNMNPDNPPITCNKYQKR